MKHVFIGHSDLMFCPIIRAAEQLCPKVASSVYSGSLQELPAMPAVGTKTFCTSLGIGNPGSNGSVFNVTFVAAHWINEPADLKGVGSDVLLRI